ncbi:hypothetical protein [Streptomyces sp. NPDC088358]
MQDENVRRFPRPCALRPNGSADFGDFGDFKNCTGFTDFNEEVPP